ncbi:hypothetical protein [Phenylobacterium koreense]|uniref:Uncharacterized protein n=1 Tax=Phenylobacterium koreense TaxID=266125 RepID=A0ABV2EM61_9CAUL
MHPAPLSTLENIYLEDSYFLGMLAVGSDLKLRGLFALTGDHPDYAPPKPGEQHCYREGDIVISGLKVTKWQAGAHPTILVGPDTELDFGSIGIGANDDGYWVETEWFEMSFQADSVKAVLDGVER